jgi:hypothetical protein
METKAGGDSLSRRRFFLLRAGGCFFQDTTQAGSFHQGVAQKSFRVHFVFADP